MVLSRTTLEEFLDYLDNSITKLAHDTHTSSEFHLDGNVEEFLSAQYDIRLENLLQRKNSTIHHLESGMKNKVIQRKKKLLDGIFKL